jgi:hypothetical protein
VVVGVGASICGEWGGGVSSLGVWVGITSFIVQVMYSFGSDGRFGWVYYGGRVG